MVSQETVVGNIVKIFQIKKKSYLLANIWQAVGVFTGGWGKEWGHVAGYGGMWQGVGACGSRVHLDKLL